MLDQGLARKLPDLGLQRLAPQRRKRRARAEPPLRIGLLNNMPDAAFLQTERQFRRLIGADCTLKLFVLPELPRGAAMQADIAKRYQSWRALPAAGLDALVITGSEPLAARLDDEPFFGPLGEVLDWAAANTISTLMSCLASHAAVLHRDGIVRRPLAEKCSGVFECAASQAGHPLLAGMTDTVRVPHSRWNALDEAELVAHGYTILRRSPEIGVDLFVRDAGSLLVFLQGHPEYDADSLAREYRRDVGRFLSGARDKYPAMPDNCFTPEGAARLLDFAARAERERDPALSARFPRLGDVLPRGASWQGDAVRLFRNWRRHVALAKASAPTRLAV